MVLVWVFELSLNAEHLFCNIGVILWHQASLCFSGCLSLVPFWFSNLNVDSNTKIDCTMAILFSNCNCGTISCVKSFMQLFLRQNPVGKDCF